MADGGIAVMGVEGAVSIIFRDRLMKRPIRCRRATLVAEYEARFAIQSPPSRGNR